MPVFKQLFHIRSIASNRKLPLLGKLEKAVTFEDLAARDAIKHLSLSNVIVEGVVGNYFIRTKSVQAIKKERWREMTLCLVPMSKHQIIYNAPDYCSFVQIKEFKKNVIVIDSKRRLNQVHPYHLDFLPNRVGFRACLSSIRNLNNSSLMSFYSTFLLQSGTYSSYKIQMLKKTQFESFEWFNKSIAGNEEQQLVVKNVVNCSAYPFPQVVFGPPGN